MDIYILNLLIIFLLTVFFILLYQVIKPYNDKIYAFLKDKGKVELIFILDFLIGIGPNISAVSVVAMFIPIKGVVITVLLYVAFLGIMIANVAYFIKHLINKR